jgi:hypothetical protein
MRRPGPSLLSGSGGPCRRGHLFLVSRDAKGSRAAKKARLCITAGIVAALLVLAPSAGSPQATSSSPGPTVTFETPGVKIVTLTACNSGGCSSVTRQLTVLAPAPVITAFSVAPPRAEVGQTVLLEAAATGQPALAFSWLVLQGGALRAVLSGPSAAWSTAGSAPGIYTVRLVVSNATGSAEADGNVLIVPEAPSRLFTVPGCRLLDTRPTAPLRSGIPPFVIPVGGHCAIPATARALVAHLTVVAPTTAGFLSVFPADYPHALVSAVNFPAGTTRGNTLVIPLSTDGAARLAASLSLASPGAAHLLVDVAGYFQPTAPPSPVPLAFVARLCALGFCELAAGTQVFFTEAFSSSAPALYRYDWLGTGAFDPPVAAPVTSHLYDQPGFYVPAVQVTTAGASTTLQAAAPLFINPADPASLPAAPAGVTATFAGFATFSPVDPTLMGTFPAYRISVANTPVNLLGYNVYLSKNGAPYRLAVALLPALPAGEPVLVDPFTPPADTLRLTLTAVNFAGEGPASAPLALTHP